MSAPGNCRIVWLVAAAAISILISDFAAAESVLHRGSGRMARSIDPHFGFGSASAYITTDLFEGLFTLSKDDKPVLGQALDYNVSDNGLVYTFVLRDDIFWSDGTPVVAEDFVYSYRRLTDPESASPMAGDALLLKNARAILRSELPTAALGVVATDERTVEITLENPASYFPYLLATPAYRPVPRHVIEVHGQKWTSVDNMVSNGPYALADQVPAQSMSLVRNEQYYASAETSIDKVVHHFIADEAAAFTRYRAGELDILGNFPSSQLEWVKENLSDQLRMHPTLFINSIRFNLAREPFSDVRVRTALNLAIDREIITDRLLRDGSPPAYSYVAPVVEGYVSKLQPFAQQEMTQRLADAKRLLAEAGFDESNPLTFTLTFSNSGRHRPIAIAVQNMWLNIGVKVELSSMGPLASILALRKRDFDLHLVELVAGYPDPMAILNTFKKDNPQNFMSYHNPAFDDLIDESSNVRDREKRFEILRQAEQVAVADSPIIPIYFLTLRVVVNPRVGGWYSSSSGGYRATKNLSLKTSEIMNDE